MNQVFETGVRYQMYHAFALIASGLLGAVLTVSLAKLRLAMILFGTGIVLFSGSLYCLALTGVSWLGFLTPIGGLSFIAGWGVVVAALLERAPSTGSQ